MLSLPRRCAVFVVVGFLGAGLLGAGFSPVQAQSSAAGPIADERLQEIDSLRATGDFRKAFSQLMTLKNDHPGTAQVLYRLALTRVDMGEQLSGESQRKAYYEDALSDAKAAVEADSTLAKAHLSRAIAEGRVALTAGTKEKIQRSRAVKRHADRAIELDSTLASAFHVRARWNREVSDLGFFERAIVKTVYGGLPTASFEQSVADFKTAIRHEDKIVHHLELARTYEKMGKEDLAREELRTVLSMNASDPDDPTHKQEAQKLLDELS